jgi:hypothetical protein
MKSQMNSEYRRSRAVEPFRKIGRSLDLALLLITLRAKNKLPGLSQLHNMTLIELGPGPTRLASFKRMLFREVYFIDKSAYEVPDKGLKLCDLAECDNVRTIVKDVCALPEKSDVFILADHFLEHQTQQVVEALLDSMRSCRVVACFRVPNIMSELGRANFENDATHRTAFADELRKSVSRMGFSISPWSRFYRPKLIFSMISRSKSTMSIAEEIVLCTQ